jgi:hypothetical protein
MRMKIAGMWLELVSYEAKLIVISGCYALIGKSAKYFNKTFPNAAMLGFVGSSPKRKGAFYEKYLDSLPSTLDVDKSNDITIIIDKWKKHIEEASSDTTLWEGGSTDPTTRKPGYMLPNGAIYYWEKKTSTWKATIQRS